MAKNPNDLTLGAATAVEVDDVDVGYTEGTVTFERSSEVKKYLSGVPRKTIVQVPIDDAFKTSFRLSQITGKNLAIAALNLALDVVAGSTVTKTNQALTMAAPNGKAIEQVSLDQPGDPDSYTSVVVKNVAESTTYTNFDDYIIDAKAGIIYRNPNGAITSGQTLHISYEYDRLDYEQLNLGKTIPIVGKKFYFKHIGPFGQLIEVYIWKAQAVATFSFDAQAEEWWNIPVELEATDDTDNHPDNPFGYVRVTFPAAS